MTTTDPGAGWPTLADVHSVVLRIDGRLARLEERHEGLGRELAQHRADDRRELDGLAEDVDRLSGRERWLAGGLATVGVLVLLVGAPVVAHLVG